MSERMVRVRWVDAIAHFDDVPLSWVEQIAEFGGVPTVSVGFLAKKTRSCVVLITTKFADECCRGGLCIPRGMIKEITYLEPHDG